MSEAKFINIKIENFFENAVLFKKCSNIHIMVNFLGSCHLASKHIGAGTQYGKYKEIYFNLKPINDEYAIILTFSGPTMFDIKKPNIKSITKEAKEILDDLISNINLLIENKSENKEMQVYLDIKGHSRGGIIAENIHKWLSLKSSNLKIKLNKLIIADPYAGPVNRIIKKRNSNFDYLNKDVKSVPESKIVVYTVAERRFRDPSKSLNSDVIVFTDVTHDKTKYIAEYIFYENKYNEGVYICADPMAKLNKIYIAVNKNPTDKEQDFINKWFSENIKLVGDRNIESILNGRENFKNFAYNKISSDGRRLLFYSALAKKCDQERVREFLENSGHKSMWKKVAKTLGLKEKIKIK